MPDHMAGLKEVQDFRVVSGRLTVPLSIFRAFAILPLIMSAQAGPSAKRRGRRAGVQVPCDDCIARASNIQDKTGNIELCEACTSVLHKPRKKEAPNVGRVRIRRQSNAIVDTALGASTTPITLPFSNDRHEQHALQFFVHNSAPQLAGYFDSPFWQRMVLQAARHEPAVKHAVAAIGALHEKLLTGAISADVQMRESRARFALEQCNKSIQYLVKPEKDGKEPDLRLTLTACVLFTCFEALQGHCEQAITHATQGYSLLQQYAMDPDSGRWDAGSFAVELDQLCLLMQRLQTQTKGLMGKDIRLTPDLDKFNRQRPIHFNNLMEARTGLELVLNNLTIFFMDLELSDQFYDQAVKNAEKHLTYGPWLKDWERAFSALLLQRQATFSEQDRKAAMVLKAHHLVAEILAEVDLSLGELGWDAFRDQFAAIVNLATAVLEDSLQSDTSVIEARWKTSGVFISSTSATLSFTLGIVDPLYEVCSRCRDPVLRRKALDLLARHPRQECMWSSWSAWKVGKFILRLEGTSPTSKTPCVSETSADGYTHHHSEEGADSPVMKSADIPLNSRVSESWLDFSDKSTEASARGRVMYKKAVPRAIPRSALNPGLFDRLASDEPIFTGMVEAGTMPVGIAPQQSLGRSGAIEHKWSDFDADWQTTLPGLENIQHGYRPLG
ncbi:hypothetical protein LTR17_023638 [Elasticomyces elasticus]|nr:hypothetical protein LTR17_023638 [Elasticomyces elasticus]